MRLLLFPVWLLVGCAPAIPFHFAETAETLKAKEVALTVSAGGGGGRDIKSCCGGGSVRVRVGVGRAMEVGGEIQAIGSENTVFLSGKVSFKLAPVRYFALLAGLGGSGALGFGGGRTSLSPLHLGADIGGVFSTDPLARVLRVYGGVRFTFALPLTDQFYENAPSQGFIVPGGLSIAATERLRVFLEGGFVGGFSEARLSSSSAVSRGDWVGGYGAAAMSYAWAR